MPPATSPLVPPLKVLSLRVTDAQLDRLRRIAERMSERAGMKSRPVTLTAAGIEALDRGMDALEDGDVPAARPRKRGRHPKEKAP